MSTLKANELERAVTISTNPALFLQMALRSLILTLVWIPVYIYRCIVLTLVPKYLSFYGKALDYIDSSEEENYSDIVPSNGLVFTMILEGTLHLKELQNLFEKTVLQAKLSNKKSGKDELRYPEFKQYQTEVGGYKFWKDDPTFDINNHMREESYKEEFASLAKVHEEFINQTFPKDRSPWEFILIRNYRNESKTLLIYRCHHTLGDTKSQIKVLVECFAQKHLKSPTVQYSKDSITDKIIYYGLMPFYFVYVQVFISLTSIKCDAYHWIKNWRKNKTAKMNVSISRISLNDIKHIAKKNNVNTSAVIIAGVAGGVAKSDKKFAEKMLPIQYVLPKIGHPDKLANHYIPAIMDLPTNITSPLERLDKCNRIFMKLKSSNLHKYRQSVMFQDATWFSPLRFGFDVAASFPLIITNIASDGEGFEVGSVPCSEFIMSSGAWRAIVCLFGYKDNLEIVTTIRDSILTEDETRVLTELIAKEFEILKSLSKP